MGIYHPGGAAAPGSAVLPNSDRDHSFAGEFRRDPGGGPLANADGRGLADFRAERTDSAG